MSRKSWDTQYALQKANEAMGHKSSNTSFMEVFIVVALVLTALLAVSDCT